MSPVDRVENWALEMPGYTSELGGVLEENCLDQSPGCILGTRGSSISVCVDHGEMRMLESGKLAPTEAHLYLQQEMEEKVRLPSP